MNNLESLIKSCTFAPPFWMSICGGDLNCQDEGGLMTDCHVFAADIMKRLERLMAHLSEMIKKQKYH